MDCNIKFMLLLKTQDIDERFIVDVLNFAHSWNAIWILSGETAKWDFYGYPDRLNTRIKFLYVVLIVAHNANNNRRVVKWTFYEAGFAERENSSPSVEWFVGGWRVWRPDFATVAREIEVNYFASTSTLFSLRGIKRASVSSWRRLSSALYDSK